MIDNLFQSVVLNKTINLKPKKITLNVKKKTKEFTSENKKANDSTRSK